MSVYFIIKYDVADLEPYVKYNPGSNHITGRTAAKHGGKIIVATTGVLRLTGGESAMKVIIQFPNREAAFAWCDDPEYVPAKAIRFS